MTEPRNEKIKKMGARLKLIYSASVAGLLLAVSCVISYWLITHLLAHTYSISRDDDVLGGMWAAVSTVFVQRYSYQQSVSAALSRMAATSVGFALCLVYLFLFPFHLWGMATLIAMGTVFVVFLGRPEDAITTAITTVVIMVVADLSPHEAWRLPILRLVDTVTGVAVGVAAAVVALRVNRPHGAPLGLALNR